jgi:hypothetical protein
VWQRHRPGPLQFGIPESRGAIRVIHRSSALRAQRAAPNNAVL